MSTSTCSKCGKEIIWDVTPAGKRHPFDARPTLVRTKSPYVMVTPGYVSHFVTCPNAFEFGRENRLPETTKQLSLAELSERAVKESAENQKERKAPNAMNGGDEP